MVPLVAALSESLDWQVYIFLISLTLLVPLLETVVAGQSEDEENTYIHMD